MMLAPGAAIAPVLAVRIRSQLPLPPVAGSKDTLTRPNEGGRPVPVFALSVPLPAAPLFTMTWVGLPNTTGPPTLVKFTVVEPLLPELETSWLAAPTVFERL